MLKRPSRSPRQILAPNVGSIVGKMSEQSPAGRSLLALDEGELAGVLTTPERNPLITLAAAAERQRQLVDVDGGAAGSERVAHRHSQTSERAKVGPSDAGLGSGADRPEKESVEERWTVEDRIS